MKTSEIYPSKYLTAEDLDGRDVTVTIEAIRTEEFGKGEKKDRKAVISFLGKDKEFVCNKTNLKTIEKVLGTDEVDDWAGQRIIIGPREVEFQGDMILALRVSLKKPAAASAAKPKPSPAAAPEEEEQEAFDTTEDMDPPF